MADAANSPVTVLITRLVRPGHEAAFEAAVRAWIPVSLSFPGHLGVHVLRPPPGGREYGAVVKFASRGQWDAFAASPEYRAFLAGIRDHLDAEPAVDTVTGLESWFTPPGTPVRLAPPRWKMALTTWVGVNLTAYALTLTLKPGLETWPFFFNFITFNAAVVAGLTWAVMPLLTRLARRWLHPR
jgi:uncharacterized protein